MITKEKFLEAIAKMKEQSDYDDNFHTHMSAAFPGSYAPIYEDELWELSIDLLQQLMEDDEEWIDWWVWETYFGKENTIVTWHTLEGELEKEWNLTTPEILYDFLVENAKRPKQPVDTTPDPNVKTLSMDEFKEIMKQHILYGKYQLFKSKQCQQQSIHSTVPSPISFNQVSSIITKQKASMVSTTPRHKPTEDVSTGSTLILPIGGQRL